MKKKEVLIKELNRFRFSSDIEKYCADKLKTKTSQEISKAIKKLPVKKLRELHGQCKEMWICEFGRGELPVVPLFPMPKGENGETDKYHSGGMIGFLPNESLCEKLNQMHELHTKEKDNESWEYGLSYIIHMALMEYCERSKTVGKKSKKSKTK